MSLRAALLTDLLPLLEWRVRELTRLRRAEQPDATGEAVPVPLAAFVAEIAADGSDEEVEYLMLAWAHEDDAFRRRHWSDAAWAAITALDPGGELRLELDIEDYVRRARRAREDAERAPAAP